MRRDMAQEINAYQTKKGIKSSIEGGLQNIEEAVEMRTYTIRIARCFELKSIEKGKTIAPFVYYSFFTFWHTTKTMAGSEPGFDDSTDFNVNMSKEFLDYLSIETLEFVVFDDKANLGMSSKEMSQIGVGDALKGIIGKAYYKLKRITESKSKQKRIGYIFIELKKRKSRKN